MGNRLTRNISSDTRILIVAAIAGLLLYVFVLPSQHPDTVLHSTLSRSDAAAAASTFLVKHGYATTGLEHSSRLSRNPSIVEAIMDSSGRGYFIESMGREQLETLPAYYWSVTFFKRSEENTWNQVYRLQLTPAGKVWKFSNVDEVYLRRTDRAAIGKLFASRPRDRSLRNVNSDSLTTPVFDFNSVSFPFKYAVEPDSASIFVERGEAEENAGEFLISPEGAAEIAQFHLEHYELAGYSFRPDSVDLEFVDDGAIARVRFKSTASQQGQRMSPVVSITSRGALYNLDVNHDSPASAESDTRMESVALSITGILFFVIGVFLLVTFFRRLIARLIDVKAALVDAFVFSTLLVLYFVFIKDLVFGFSNIPMWARLLMPVLIGSFVGGGMSVLLFLFISSADSLARPHWPKRLLSASLLRQGRVMNARVGQALVRGVLFGFVLVGINVLVLVLLPWAKLSLSSDFIAGESVRAIVTAIGMQGFISYVQLGVVLLAVCMTEYPIASISMPRKLAKLLIMNV